jgi:hypothetical protein
MISHVKHSIVVILAMLVTISCTKTHRSSIVGDWSGDYVTIAKGEESISVPIRKYGYFSLSLASDSTFTMSVAVLKDLRVEKEVFGMTMNKVLIPAVYKSTRFGKWARSDSSLRLFNGEKVLTGHTAPNGEEMTLTFTDAEDRRWSVNLEPKE